MKTILLVCLLVCLPVLADSAESERMQRILQKAAENEKLAEQYGYYQEKIQKKLDDGKIKEQNSKLYRMVWLEDQPYLELVQINGEPLNKKQMEEETKQKSKFLKSLKKSEEEKDTFSWEELYGKYDFDSLPSDSGEHSVFTFRPKSGKLQERSHFEKILNHLQGKVWVDSENNIVRVEAQLEKTVRFGLGIVAKLDRLSLEFEQKAHEDVWLPAMFNVHFRVRIALLRTDEQEIRADYYDYYRGPLPVSDMQTSP
jgi:hypothetical protein